MSEESTSSAVPTRKFDGGHKLFGIMQNFPILGLIFLHKKSLNFTPPTRQAPQSKTRGTAIENTSTAENPQSVFKSSLKFQDCRPKRAGSRPLMPKAL